MKIAFCWLEYDERCPEQHCDKILGRASLCDSLIYGGAAVAPSLAEWATPTAVCTGATKRQDSLYSVSSQRQRRGWRERMYIYGFRLRAE